MDNLLSGLLGALFATVLSVVYSHVSNRKRDLQKLAITAVTYSDEIYSDIQVIDAYKDILYKKKGSIKENTDQYTLSSQRLRTSILSSQIHIRAALLFGDDSEELDTLNGLRSYYVKCSRLLWASNEGNWKDTHKEILNIFESQIDPLRNLLENRLIKSAKTINIIKDAIKLTQLK